MSSNSALMKSVVLVVCSLSASLAQASYPLRIHHRIWDPTSSPPPPFSLRVEYQVSPDFDDSVSLVKENPTKLVLGSHVYERIIYQVALEREGDLSESDWDISSAKACHLPHAEADIINVHLSSRDRSPYAIDYFLHPIPHDGSCPTQSDGMRTEIALTNTTINFRLAEKPPSPELRVPPPLSPEGQPIQPEPEKSFVQKYWMYLTIGLLTLLLVGSSPEDEQGGSAQGRAGGARIGGR